MYRHDTIAAISTPVGEGGIGIVRVSGPDVLPLVRQVIRRSTDGDFESHRFYYGMLIDPLCGDAVDEVLAVVMKKPHSYTREDVLEIQCHGGYLVTRRVLDVVLGCGVRLAEPGEFTRRAFLNGRIDLVQAEAVIELIRSKTETSLALARHQYEGRLSSQLHQVRDSVRYVLALLEAFVDFPEEEIDPVHYRDIDSTARSALQLVGDLIAGFAEGKVLRDGVSVLIAGKPNVGKSSLLNTLVQEKRAIVTSIPGTTRDIIEEVVSVRGLPVKVLDTAGVRSTSDPVEREGVQRALERIPLADLILLILDRSRPLDEDDRLLFEAVAGHRYLVVLNKVDQSPCLELPACLNGAEVVSISTLTGEGIDALRVAIFSQFMLGKAVDSREYVVVSQVRHRDALLRAERHLKQFLDNLDAGFAPELLSVDLRDVLGALGEVTGETTPDDVLDIIFQRFCIGK